MGLSSFGSLALAFFACLPNTHAQREARGYAKPTRAGPLADPAVMRALEAASKSRNTTIDELGLNLLASGVRISDLLQCHSGFFMV